MSVTVWIGEGEEQCLAVGIMRLMIGVSQFG